VISVEQSGDTLYVDYNTYHTTPEGIAGEVAYIAGAYSTMVDSGNDSERLEAEVFVLGTPIGEWYVEAEWAQDFADGEIDEYEFTQRVLETVESYE
jgi:hypothetical protein